MTRRLFAIVVAALSMCAPASGYYADGGSGGNRPDCTQDNAGDSWGNWTCLRDPFAPPGEGYEWVW
jgi:hypothetical protein